MSDDTGARTLSLSLEGLASALHLCAAAHELLTALFNRKPVADQIWEITQLFDSLSDHSLYNGDPDELRDAAIALIDDWSDVKLKGEIPNQWIELTR